MTEEQFLSLCRSILKIAGTLLVAHGYANDALVGEVSGVTMTLAAVVWSQVKWKKVEIERNGVDTTKDLHRDND